ncbi:MAG: AAA family ATPase [Candidatus Cohnella colombiensis]|uniref:AAA family ATPase n=1 Tax=Candidatus Cohnella colombiensis TaxID=3121368 RepID=A0AA95F221_9BACL|nr:MAG: AAA family ATPase [Cohnella sp.]
MYIRELQVEGYGALSAVNLKLDAPVTIIYGTNEAGKSTLLRFTRSMLYGFPTRKDPVERGEPVRGGRHGGRLVVVTNDGQELVLERYADRTAGLTVRDENGQERTYSQVEWERLRLGGISEKLFRQLFAVSLDELHQLRSLQGEEIGNYIYNAGLAGGAALSSAKRKITAELDKLYRPKGSTQEINKLIASLKVAEANLRLSEDRVAAYKETAVRLFEVEAQLAQVDEQIPTLRQQVTELQSVYELREWWLRWKLLQLELEEARHPLPNPSAPLLADVTIMNWTRLKQNKAAILAKLLEVRATAAELERRKVTTASDRDEVGRLSRRKEGQGKAKHNGRATSNRLSYIVSAVLGGIAIAIPIIVALTSERVEPLHFILTVLLLIAPGMITLDQIRKGANRDQTVGNATSPEEQELVSIRAYEVMVEDQLQAVESEMSQLLEDIQAADSKELEQRILIDEHCRSLQRDMREMQLRLESGRSEENKRKLYHFLENNDETALTAMLDQSSSVLDSEEQKRSELLDQRGRLAHELERLQREAEAEDRSSIIREQESRLDASLERYAILSLSERLMVRTKELFEEERQPEVLQLASRYFEQMTGGTYTRIIVPGDQPTLRVETKERGSIDSSFLSRGTQEQLYLAMRFALAGAAAMEQPLPLLLDDLFVHFDERRLEQMLPVISEIALTRQLILFTCHRHVAQSIAQAIPSSQMVILPERGG